VFLKPFAGTRPDSKYVSIVNVPPYDMVSYQEVGKAIKYNPFSFFRVTRPDGEMLESGNEYSDEVYKRARENFEYFLREKILFKEVVLGGVGIKKESIENLFFLQS